MWKSFNSKIFALALSPLYAYVLISVFVFIKSGYQFAVFNILSMLLIGIGTTVAALCFSFSKRTLHMIAFLILLLLGGIGIYIGFASSPLNWSELIASAAMIAFAFAMKDFVGNRLYDR